MKDIKTGWWKIDFTIEPTQEDLEYISEEIKKGFVEGEIHQENAKERS